MSPDKKRAAEDGCLKAVVIEFHSRGAVIANDLDMTCLISRTYPGFACRNQNIRYSIIPTTFQKLNFAHLFVIGPNHLPFIEISTLIN